MRNIKHLFYTLNLVPVHKFLINLAVEKDRESFVDWRDPGLVLKMEA